MQAQQAAAQQQMQITQQAAATKMEINTLQNWFRNGNSKNADGSSVKS